MSKFKVSCNGETLAINGKYVVDCCESLEYTFELIADALGVSYEWVEDEDEE